MWWLRWLKAVSKTQNMMGHHNHSLSVDAAIMVSEQPNYWWKHCHVFDTMDNPYQTEYDLLKNTLDGFKCL